MASKAESLPLVQLSLGSLLAVAVLWLYWPVLVSLFTQLSNDEDYSFGLLLPFVSGYIIYLKWPEIRSQVWRPAWQGLFIIILAFSIYISGQLIAHDYSIRFSILVLIAGLLLFIGGKKILLQFTFPLLILILMLPLPTLLTSAITMPLQLISSRLAAMLLRMGGIPLVLQGNVIDLGTRQLQVVAACSGLRYILSLIALGIIYCYFYQRQLWKAVVLIISLIPAAIIANAMRVAAMGIFPALLEGFWHAFSGWLIFLFCFGFLALVNWLVNYLSPPPRPRISPAGEPESSSPKNPGKQTVPAKTSLTVPLLGALLIVICGSLAVHAIGEPPPVPLLQSFDHFPLRLGLWQGDRSYIDPQIFQATEADSYFDANYSAPDQKAPVSLYIAHYEKQGAGGLGHNPGVCMTGAGWQTLESGTREIGPGLAVNYLLLKREGAGTLLLVYYWNILQGKWMALGGARTYKLYTIFNALHTHRTDWALIRLITPVTKDKKSAEQRLNDFAHSLIPVLPQFIKQ